MQLQPRSHFFAHLSLVSLSLLPLACSSGGGGAAAGSGNNNQPLTAADLDGRWNITTRVATVTGTPSRNETVGQTSTFLVTITLSGSTVVIRSADGSVDNARLDGSRVRASMDVQNPPLIATTVTDFGVVNRQLDGTFTTTERNNGAVVSTVVERFTGARAAAAAVDTFLSNVQLNGGIAATRMTGAPPAAGNGPAVVPTSPGTVINGGTSQVAINCASGIDALLVSVAGTDGHYRIPLGSVQNLINLVVSFGADIPSENFQCVYAGERNGQVGPPSPATVVRRGVGTGRVQLNLSWDSRADLDLHLIEPSGTEIWYGATTSPSGGALDLDSNAGCSAGISNENVTYGSVMPPSGEYIVRVDNFDACNAEASNFVVRINIEGRPPMVFNGTMTGAGSGAGAGGGQEIARFSF